ncbi:MAG: alpha/beta hydrolase [Acutalibacteraceae bacterium]|nr:alpha/beta hydrolase [Acutalibacteraceae bacterium]
MLFIILLFFFVILTVTVISYICFRITFYADRNITTEEFSIPEGKIYEPYREIMINWMKEIKDTEKEKYSIKSFDGLRLTAKYYECKKNAPIELMFHGYRGDAMRDLCGGVQRCFKLNRNAFIVDQRACGDSEGNIISFGVNESKDCLNWIDFIINKFGKDVKIILTGISMGASTVLMASGEKLPENVIGVLADCGYNSAEEIIKKIIKEKKLPINLSYFFVRLGALLFGKFDINQSRPVDSVKKAKIPIIFFHGTDDKFVPYYMSEQIFEVTASKKRLILIDDAGHGLSYLKNPNRYLNELSDFFG